MTRSRRAQHTFVRPTRPTGAGGAAPLRMRRRQGASAIIGSRLSSPTEPAKWPCTNSGPWSLTFVSKYGAYVIRIASRQAQRHTRALTNTWAWTVCSCGKPGTFRSIPSGITVGHARVWHVEEDVMNPPPAASPRSDIKRYITSYMRYITRHSHFSSFVPLLLPTRNTGATGGHSMHSDGASRGG